MICRSGVIDERPAMKSMAEFTLFSKGIGSTPFMFLLHNGILILFGYIKVYSSLNCENRILHCGLLYMKYYSVLMP